MTSLEITLTPGQADQILRALAGRKRQFRKTLPAEVFDDLLTAQQTILTAVQALVPVHTVDTAPEPAVRSTRKRRTTKKED